MGKESLSAETSSRICKHMNEDHQEAVLAYASYYGGRPRASQARMTSITSKAMDLLVDGELIRISFNHILSDSEDAHRTLVAMLRTIPKEILEC